MTTEINTPYKDTSSKELSWAWGLPPQSALSEKTLTLGEWEINMRLLGASHQIIAVRENKTYSEVVACLDNAGKELPEKAHVGENYNFVSQVLKLDREKFKQEVENIKTLTAGENSLSAVFPGSPYALTAMTVRRDGNRIIWETWHAYPQHNEIVKTRSELNA